MVHDGEAAEHDVAVGVAAEHPRGGHDPAHAERRADLLRLALVPRAGADHLLQRDDVGADPLQHLRDPIRPRAAVEPATPVDVVGGHPHQSSGRLAHDLICRVYHTGMSRLKSELELTCPCCGATLVFDRNLERIVEHKEPERADKPELSNAQRIVAAEAERRDALFQQSVEAEKTRGDALSKRFEEALRQARQEPVTRPHRDFDLD